MRKPRQKSASGFYHVMFRGINREYVFKKEKYKKKLWEELLVEKEKGFIEIFAWCIMDNHVHLLLKGDLPDISKVIKVICLKFAAFYNHGEGRTGPVFGDRYRSENIEDDRYLLGVLRYIHNNPVKAKIIDEPSKYIWSSYGRIINENMKDDETKKFIMSFFNGSIREFEVFHKEPDYTEYLEIKEDLKKFRLEKAQAVMESFFNDRGVSDRNQLGKDSLLLQELVLGLVKETNLTYRQIAELTGMQPSKISVIKKRNGLRVEIKNNVMSTYNYAMAADRYGSENLF